VVLNLEICLGKGIPVPEKSSEFVERKGKGHPDSICDNLSEELSLTLSQYYIKNFGRILHHNVDKSVLAGGRANPRFGGGEVIEPMYFLIVGRALDRAGSRPIPIGKLVEESTKNWLKNEFRFLDPEIHMIIDHKIRSGSPDLIGNFDENSEIPLANDTSFGVGYAPLSETERVVLEVEKTLNSKDIKRIRPEIGEDIKIMGIRRGNRIHLTIAAAIIASLTKSIEHYEMVRGAIRDIVLGTSQKITNMEVSVNVNSADIPSKGLYYLTVTGLSAEQGDDGQVGRGNRANGLITPGRPMTLEAAAGKNPINHTGKIYNVAAQQIVDTMIKEEGDKIKQVSCCMVSEIGKPISQPRSIEIEIYSDEINLIKPAIESVVESTLNNIPKIWSDILERKCSLF
jgi:S-adenosylmethionine synthetase